MGVVCRAPDAVRPARSSRATTAGAVRWVRHRPARRPLGTGYRIRPVCRPLPCRRRHRRHGRM